MKSGGSLYPGQVERLEFDLDQLTAIASAPRSEVFWTFRSDEPLSIAEAAREMGKPAASVGYHVNELVRVGLLIVVGQRRSHSRTEKLYVHAGLQCYGRGHPMTPEYRRQGARGFSAILRMFARERAALHRVLPHRMDLGDFCLFSVFSIRLKREDALELREEMRSVLRKYLERQDPSGTRVHLTAISHPDMGEIRGSYLSATGEVLGEEAEDTEEAGTPSDSPPPKRGRGRPRKTGP